MIEDGRCLTHPFDGEIPEFAFREDDEPTRLKFGRWYLVPGPDGIEVEARLYEASVLENEKRIYGIYESRDGRHFIAMTPMTDNELAAWKRHPETFFGEIRHIGGNVDNWLELAKFMYQTYQHTAREKLLEWMKDVSSDARCNAPADLVSAGSRPQGVLPCAAIRICQMTKENRLVC